MKKIIGLLVVVIIFGAFIYFWGNGIKTKLKNLVAAKLSDRKETSHDKSMYKKIRNKEMAAEVREWVQINCSSYGGPTAVIDLSPKIQIVEVADYADDGGNQVSNGLKTFIGDVKSGKMYSISDLFKPETNWPHAIWPYVQVKIKECELMPPLKEEWGSQAYGSFSLDRHNLKLYFDRCLWAPCACGALEVDVPLNEIKESLNPVFLEKMK